MLKKAILVFVLLLFAPHGAGAEGKKLTVAAASDLAFALEEISASFEDETGAEIILSLGSTGLLSRQIEGGAPFDVFFAASIRHMDDLRKGGHVIPDTVEVYAQGRIVLAVNRASGVRAEKLEDLLREDVKRVAIANPVHAPYGAAAMEALESSGLWEAVKGKLVYGENVRQALQFVQTGNAQAGIIALSIAEVPEVSYTPIDAGLHKPIEQAVAVVKGAKDEALAREFIEYVKGPGRPVLKKYGFVVRGE